MKLMENMVQGSAEWHKHRSTHFNASDAPAMLGVSPYKTRQELLREMATGITADIDPATQRRFDEGHRFEALARPLAEKIIGKSLYPVIGSEGKLSASFDGLTSDDEICFEHKTNNSGIRSTMGNTGDASFLPEHYRVQMEQQLMVSGANKCLFMASIWEGDELQEETHGWYVRDLALGQRIIDGWKQFEKDLAEYQHIEVAEKPKGAAIMDLPALSVQATGMVTYSNLPEFKAAAERYIAGINTTLTTDQHFADAEAAVKFCKATEEKLEVTKGAILAQTASIDEVIRTVDHIQAQLRDKRLMLDKMVKSEKEVRKVALVQSAGQKYTEHVHGLAAEISGINFALLAPHLSLSESIRGLKSIASMQDALNTALANGKIEADAIAKDVRDKLVIYSGTKALGYEFLFRDLQTLITKPKDDFELVIQTRVESYINEEKSKREAERQRIEAEAKVKAEREAAAKIAAEEARIRAEERANAEAEAKERTEAEAKDQRGKTSSENLTPVSEVQSSGRAVVGQYENAKKAVAEASTPPTRPYTDEIITAIADHFCVSFGTAYKWILEIADAMKEAA